MKARVFAVASLLVLLLGACGGDDDGDGDTLLTGLSGVVIAVIVVYLIMRSLKRRR